MHVIKLQLPCDQNKTLKKHKSAEKKIPHNHRSKNPEENIKKLSPTRFRKDKNVHLVQH